MLHLAAHVVHGELFALGVRIVSDVALANLIDAVASWNHLQILLLGLLEPTRMVERVDELAGVLETRHSTDMTSPHLTRGNLAVLRRSGLELIRCLSAEAWVLLVHSSACG